MSGANPLPSGDVEAAQPQRPRDSRGLLRVLVVEDDAQLADFLCQNITMNGHEVAVARDAASAIAVTEQFRPAVVLLDIGLPGMDGYAVADRIRSVPGMEDIRVVAVTGYALPTDRRRSRVAGFDRHLAKPVNLDDLERILDAWAEEAAHRTATSTGARGRLREDDL